MEWLKPLLPLLQTGLKMYASGQIIKQTSRNAKSVAVQSSIIAFGSITFLIFFVAGILMTFIDLGNQFESRDGVHFSGMMLSSLYLVTLGLAIFAICFGIARYVAAREGRRKEVAKTETNPYAPLIAFGEEFLKVLIQNLNQKPASGEARSTGEKPSA